MKTILAIIPLLLCPALFIYWQVWEYRKMGKKQWLNVWKFVGSCVGIVIGGFILVNWLVWGIFYLIK